MQTLLIVKTHSYSYPVVQLDTLHELTSLINVDNTHIIIDKIVFDLYSKNLDFTSSKSLYFFEASEQNKSLTEIEKMATFFEQNKIQKNDKLLVIGGGITGDVASFLASILLRGVSWEFVPTTLLSMADSSVGGKNGVNLGEVKNYLGRIYPPLKVYLHQDFLKTLGPIEKLSGLGEIVKSKFLTSFEEASSFIKEEITTLSDSELFNNAVASLSLKKSFVETDENDKGDRQLLNLGHSFGHALEALTSFNIPHGVAVIWGIQKALEFSVWKNLLTIDQISEVRVALQNLHQPFTERTLIDPAQILNFIKSDKKNGENKLGLILFNKEKMAHKVLVDYKELESFFLKEPYAAL